MFFNARKATNMLLRECSLCAFMRGCLVMLFCASHYMDREKGQCAGWDPTWDEVFQRKEWGRYPPEYVVRFVMRNWGGVPDRSKISLLDLGSGPGAVTWFLAREGFKVSAIDGSRVGMERLQSRLAHEGLHCEAAVGDYVDLPWADSIFDGIIDNVSLSSNTSAHSRRCIEQVLHKLKPSGLFFSAGFGDRTWGCGLGEKVEPGTYINIPEGPLAGTGLVRFTSRSQIESLYWGFSEVTVERTEWTLANMAQIIELWLVTCRK
jgi:SAM-dependent methyltransferase